MNNRMRKRWGFAISTSALVGLGVVLFSRRAEASMTPLQRYPSMPPQPPELPVPEQQPPGPEALPGSEPAATPPGDEPEQPAEAPPTAAPIDWYGGTGPDNEIALEWMLASENPKAGPLVWFLQALAANNVARRRKRLGIHSIKEMLQSGVQGKKYLKNIGWGPNWDKATKISRFAATSAALTSRQPPKKIVTFVDDLLSGRINPEELRGPHGEEPPPPSTWNGITNFLQHQNFDRVVEAQLGHPGKTEAQKLEDWGNPSLVAEVAGVRFFAPT